MRTDGKDFIRAIIDEDMESGKHRGRVATRFPPEPNGYLHIGHAKSISLNFGIAADFDGVCHLRFDDTNPETEDVKFVEAIQEDIRWLGFDWGEHLYFASDYFEQFYQFAVELIEAGRAYVDSLNSDQIREYRGTVTEPGRNSPYRDRTVEENLDLLERMRRGEFPDGAHVLRAKIDMAAPNMKMRDPLLYRIRHASHYRTGDAWCIYPMYDFAHPLSDAVEHITHSVCTLEFENNREIYDWLVDELFEPPRPYQYEFARLNLDYTVMSKRKLLQLVEDGHVAGWDDPRLPTIAGLRRRGVTPQAIRAFSERIGVAKANSRVDIALLDHTIRDDLNHRAPRVMCVLRPLKIVITNYPEGQSEELEAPYWPHDVPNEGVRNVPFAREIYIEQDDFMEEPTRGFRRLSPGEEVRLRYAYVIKCESVIKDPATGEVTELHCTHDPETRGGATPDGRKVRSTIHWVSAAHAVRAEVRLYDRLFTTPNPEEVEEGKSFLDYLNPTSVEVLANSAVEPSVADDPPGSRYQFERQGYFISDAVDSQSGALVFNRIVALRDTWARATESAQTVSQPGMDGDAAAQEEVVVGSRSEERDQARVEQPELAERMARYEQELNLSFEDADILSGDRAVSDFFEAALAACDSPRSVSNWVINMLLPELRGEDAEALPFDGAALGRLVKLVDEGTISNNGGKELLATMLRAGGDPEALVDTLGLRQVSDEDSLAPLVAAVIAKNPEKTAEYRAGKTGLIGFFMGQVMRETKGSANPQLVRQLLEEEL